jgi:ATP-dependent Lhr-like helicase
VLPLRVKGYKREWLDSLTLSGEAAWGRLWGGGASAIRITPICVVPREDWTAGVWLSSAPPDVASLSGPAKDLHAALMTKGAMFPQELARAAKLVPAHVEMGLGELIAQGLLTCDSFGALRWLIVPPSKRRGPMSTVGRWSLFRREALPPPGSRVHGAAAAAPHRVVFRRTIEREKMPVPWRDLARVYRTLEARGEIRGGPLRLGIRRRAVTRCRRRSRLMRAVRKARRAPAVSVSGADPSTSAASSPTTSGSPSSQEAGPGRLGKAESPVRDHFFSRSRRTSIGSFFPGTRWSGPTCSRIVAQCVSNAPSVGPRPNVTPTMTSGDAGQARVCSSRRAQAADP